MPAAAVIPAPIAYIKVVAVKKLVVGFLAISRVRSMLHLTILIVCGICYWIFVAILRGEHLDS